MKQNFNVLSKQSGSYAGKERGGRSVSSIDGHLSKTEYCKTLGTLEFKIKDLGELRVIKWGVI